MVDVTVVTPAGTSPVSPADRFTYQGGSSAMFAEASAIDAILAHWTPKSATAFQVDYLLAEILTDGGGLQGLTPFVKKGD